MGGGGLRAGGATLTAATRAVSGFRRTHRQPPARLVRAPGRVNLIGDHTDYQTGWWRRWRSTGTSSSPCVLDTGVRRELLTSGYNARRRETDEVAAALGVGTLRAADVNAAAALDAPLRSRARHVITENARHAGATAPA